MNAILGQMCTSSEPGCSTATSGAYPDAIEWPTTTIGPLTFFERLERRADAVCVRRLRIVERKIGRDRLVTARFEAVDQRLPAGAVVPVAVEETERRQVRKLRGAAERAEEEPGRFEVLVVARHAEATKRPEHEHDTTMDRLSRYRAEDAAVL